MGTFLRRLERIHSQHTPVQWSESLKDLQRSQLQKLLLQLKSVDEERFRADVKQIRAASDMVVAMKAKTEDPAIQDELRDSEVELASRKLNDMVLSLFDCHNLLRIHEYLKGHTQWQSLLRDLKLPLEDLKHLKAYHERTPAKNNTQRQQESRINDLLDWLSAPEPYPSIPTPSSYDDGAIRQRALRAMQMQVDNLEAQLQVDRARSQESNSGATRVGSESQPHPSSPKSPADRPQQLQPQQTDPTESNVTRYIFSEDQLEALLARCSSTSGGGTIPTQSDACMVHSFEQPIELQEDTDLAIAQRHSQRKVDEQNERAQQKSYADYRKIEARFWAFELAIEQLKAFQHGGAHPTSIVGLGVPDVQACYCRLEQLWKDLKLDIPGTYDIKNLRGNHDAFYNFAIIAKETHFVLHLLPYYGDQHTHLAQTGWSLSHMRWLQSDMATHANEQPLIWCKDDVDMICAALQFVSPNEVLVARPHSMGGLAAATTQPRNVPQDCPATSAPVLTQPVVQPMRQLQQLQFVQPGATLHVPAYQPAANPQQEILDPIDDAMDVSQTLPAQPFQPSGFQGFQSQHPAPEFSESVLLRLKEAAETGRILAADSHVASAAGLLTSVDHKSWKIAQNGDALWSELKGNYCDNWSKKKCRNKKCKYLHEHYRPKSGQQQAVGPSNTQSNLTQHNVFQGGGGQGVQADRATAQQAARPPKHETRCRYETATNCCTNVRCEYLHFNPRSRQYQANASIREATAAYGVIQSIGDAVMSDVAFNGDHCSAALARAPAQADKYASPCINEAGNKLCNSVKCWYTHSKPTSKNFGKTKPGTKQGGPQGNNHQQGTRGGGSGGHNGGPRAPHDHRLNSNQHNLQRILAQVAQQSQQPSGIPTEVWARGVQRPAVSPNQQPAQQVQRNALQNGGGAHNITCYGCGQVGHDSNMCPNKANNHGNNRGGGDASNVTCYDCHE